MLLASLPTLKLSARFHSHRVAKKKRPGIRENAGPLLSLLQSSAVSHQPSAVPGEHSSKQSVELVEVVDDAPAAAALLHLPLPALEALHVFARVVIVRAQLHDVQCNHF